MFCFKVEDVEIGDEFCGNLQYFVVYHSQDKHSFCVENLAGLVLVPIVL